MTDNLDQLQKVVSDWKSRHEIAWAWVTIELVDVPAGRAHYSGVVLIDGRQVGWLVGNLPREFRRAPGEHSIAVRLGQGARVAAYPGRGIVKARIELKPGERAELACGTDGPAAEAWDAFGRRVQRLHLVGLGLICLAGGLSWLLLPILKPSIVEAIRSMRMWDALALSQRSPEAFRLVFAIWTAGAIQLLTGLPYGIWAIRTRRRLLAEVGAPYRIGRRMVEHRS